MKSKDSSIRVFGQRSISSTFIRKPPSSSSSHSNGDPQIKVPTKVSRVSLSDFLDRRLNKTLGPPKTVQGKQKHFLSPLGCSNARGSIHGLIGVRKGEEDKAEPTIDLTVFKQFKHSRKEKEEFICSSGIDETGSFDTDNMQESRKRKNPCEGGIAPKYLVVLGDDPKPKQRGTRENFNCNKKPRPLFNHYANGSGWWDCNMEGVDGEEVGCNEAWEGVGSTTLGGLEWH